MFRSILEKFRGLLTIRIKFLILFSFISILLITVNVISFTNSRNVNSVFEDFIFTDTPRLLLLTDIRDSVLLLEKEVSDLFYNTSLSSEDLINRQNELLSISAKIDAQSAEYLSLLEKDSEKAQDSVIELSRLKENIIIAVVDEIRLLDRNENTNLNNLTIPRHGESISFRANSLTAYTDVLIQRELNHQRETRKDLLEKVTLNNYLRFGELGVLILFLFFIMVYILHAILRPIKELHDAVLYIAKGDLNKTVKIHTKDEIGDLGTAFNTMSAGLKESHKEVEERTKALSEEEEKLEILVKALPIGVAVIRAIDGKTILINQRGIELLGKGIDPNATLDNANEVYKILKEDGTQYPVEELTPSIALRTGLPAESHDSYIQRPDNTRIALKTVATPLKDKNNKIISVIIVFDDITKEHDIDKAKTEFVSLASHQLRTPLSTINWYTEMLMAGDAGPVNENQKKFLGEIYLGSTRMVELVNALLNVSRLELGTFVIEPEPTDMVALVRSVMDEQKPQLDERKQKLVPDLDKTLPIIQVDPKLMRMVVQNLLSNSIKYTPEEGTVQITLSLDDEKKNMLLKVSDIYEALSSR